MNNYSTQNEEEESAAQNANTYTEGFQGGCHRGECPFPPRTRSHNFPHIPIAYNRFPAGEEPVWEEADIRTRFLWWGWYARYRPEYVVCYTGVA